MYPNTRKRRRDEFEGVPQLTQSKEMRRKTDIEERLEFLEKDVKVKLNGQRKNAKKLPPYPIIIRRREMTLEEHRRVIWLRFGSLDSMEHVWHRSCEVHKITGVCPGAQYKIIKRWLQNGKQILSLKFLRGRKKKLSYE